MSGMLSNESEGRLKELKNIALFISHASQFEIGECSEYYNKESNCFWFYLKIRLKNKPSKKYNIAVTEMKKDSKW